MFTKTAPNPCSSGIAAACPGPISLRVAATQRRKMIAAGIPLAEARESFCCPWCASKLIRRHRRSTGITAPPGRPKKAASFELPAPTPPPPPPPPPTPPPPERLAAALERIRFFS